MHRYTFKKSSIEIRKNEDIMHILKIQHGFLLIIHGSGKKNPVKVLMFSKPRQNCGAFS
jgi:hypothetical protein